MVVATNWCWCPRVAFRAVLLGAVFSGVFLLSVLFLGLCIGFVCRLP